MGWGLFFLSQFVQYGPYADHYQAERNLADIFINSLLHRPFLDHDIIFYF